MSRRLLRASAAAASAVSILILHSCASTSAARPLFNGRDLTGWLGDSNTWRAENSLLITTGNPYGFIRTTRPYTNFILDLDWQHQPRPDTLPGNSGLFIWADSIASPASTQFPKSVEVQILVGLEWRDKSTNALTATSHGDIFPIWGATCKPDRPHPRGWQRSIPTEFRAKSFGHWNHYRVTAIDGTITLAVNGKAVSKVTDCQPRTGYIALEAEGNTVHFRNIRIQELP